MIKGLRRGAHRPSDSDSLGLYSEEGLPSTIVDLKYRPC